MAVWSSNTSGHILGWLFYFLFFCHTGCLSLFFFLFGFWTCWLCASSYAEAGRSTMRLYQLDISIQWRTLYRKKCLHNLLQNKLHLISLLDHIVIITLHEMLLCRGYLFGYLNLAGCHRHGLANNSAKWRVHHVSGREITTGSWYELLERTWFLERCQHWYTIIFVLQKTQIIFVHRTKQKKFI